MGESAFFTPLRIRRASTLLIKMTEKRYCTSCQVMRPADYGKMIKAGKVTRWKCTACFERINIPRYAKKGQKK
jgi:hypothetical protein